MRGKRQHGVWLFTVSMAFVLSAPTAWGYYFDDRREMSLSGFAYSRATIALDDGISGAQNTYYTGNLVQHRNFLTLEWRHNLNRVSRDFPTIGPLFQFLNWSAFDYYINLRTEYDGVWAYGPNKMRRMMSGTRRFTPYFDDRNTAVPFDGLYFTPGASPDFPGDTISLTNRRWLRDFRGANVRLFEWYFNITKGPLFLRIGRQNLSWGETDGFRLLDQINPLDNSFAGFLTSLDERRIPLNMLRAQWSFGNVGPIQDLTLEGFVSIDDETAQPGLPTSSTNYWGSIQGGNTAIMKGRTPCGGDFMEKRGIPAYFRDPDFPYEGSGAGPNYGGNCSNRARGPHSSIEDARGGGRLIGTIRDFTWSIAHYYTYQDLTQVRAIVISPTRDHLRWDLGLDTDSQGRPWEDNLVETQFGTGNTANPWGVEDPFAARAISSGANAFGRGNIGSVGGAERNVRSTVEFERIQVSGGSLSFPLNALTSMFVGSDSALFYLYTTFRSEVAYFRDVPIMRAYAHGDGSTAFDRFLGGALGVAGGAFAPGGLLADEAGARTTAYDKRDVLAWNIGLDHNQWIRFLNPSNSFTFSAQQFWVNVNGQKTTFRQGEVPSVLNDKNVIAGRKRQFQQPVTDPALAATCAPGSGSRAGCSLWNFGGQTWLTTLAISTPYLAGNLTPRVTGFYDWSGSWLVQPGIDWTFWDPFRLQVRYNYIDGKGNSGIGIFNRKDNIWFELQYLLY